MAKLNWTNLKIILQSDDGERMTVIPEYFEMKKTYDHRLGKIVENEFMIKGKPKEVQIETRWYRKWWNKLMW